MEEKSLSRIGKYEILDKIGEGGFGVVYKGRDPFIKRLVAVKTCSSENQQVQQRFFREAEIAGNLHHANVVTIHDFGIEGETPYLVQEFLTGEDLDVIIKEAFENLGLATKVRYLRGIAEGLRYAHSQGVIHRDIKPANIRVLENGRVKVMDFGIAKLKDQESQLTQTGMALGTVAYMSPEQLRGEKIDHRVDIFSYGVLAYELLSGRRPFRAETVSTLFYQLLHEPPPPLDLPGLPPQLRSVVERCLEKSVAERYQSFDEVIVALDQVQAEITAGEEPPTGDLFRPDAQSEAESAALRLAAKAQRSIDAGDLTAAAMTINMARREVDQATFERVFSSVLEAFRDLELHQAASAQSGPRLDDTEHLLNEVELKLLADDFQGAEAALGRLEAQIPNDSRVRALRQRFTAALASRPTSPGAARERVEPPPPPSVTQDVDLAAVEAPTLVGGRGLGRLPLAIGAVAVGLAIVVLLAWIVISSPGSGTGTQTDIDESSTVVDDPELPGGADRETQLESTGTEISTDTDGVQPDELPTDGDTQVVTPPQGGEQQQTGSTSPTSSGGTNAGDRRTQPGTNPSTQGQSGQAGSRSSGDSRGEDRERRTQQTDTRREESTRPGTSSRQSGTSGSRTPGTGDDRVRSEDRRTTEGTTTQRETQPEEPEVAPTIQIADLREQNAIRATLTAYQNAWKSLDHEAVNRVHPGANLSRRDLRQYRLVDVAIQGCAYDIEGDRATATCNVTRTLEPRDGSPARVERFGGFRLVKQGSHWSIADLLPGG